MFDAVDNILFIADSYKEHKGYLPLEIKAVPEGSVVACKNVLLTVENTDPNVPWLTNWFETLLVQVWYPCTVCTNSRSQKELIAEYMRETCASFDSLRFKLHDFGYRGSTSVESAAIGDAAHLVNFMGTDTVAGIQLCKKFYGCEMAGFSIPASEHSTMTTWGEEHELEACRNMLEAFPPSTAVSVVSDSYDIYNCVNDIWCRELKDLVTRRGQSGGTLVIRPDSGDPKEVVIKILKILEHTYPCELNSKGFKVLPSYIRIIQGDGIYYESLRGILEAVKEAGWSVDNLVFGSGGALLQRLHRDTQRCAFKCSSIRINGEDRAVFKRPVTDAKKTSKKGRLTLEKREDSWVTVEDGKGDPLKDCLVTVFRNGELLIDWTLDEIRERAEISLVKKARAAKNVSEMNGEIPM